MDKLAIALTIYPIECNSINMYIILLIFFHINTMINFMKNIQVSFDEKTITILEQIANLTNKTRTAVIREAVDEWLKQKRIDDFESRWINALKKEASEDSDVWLAAEEWDDS